MLNAKSPDVQQVQPWLMPRKEIQEYNRALLRSTNCHKSKTSNIIRYAFHFKCADDNDVIDDFTVAERSYLMTSREVERVWDDLAEQNSRYFVRGEMSIVFPHCNLVPSEEPEF